MSFIGKTEELSKMLHSINNFEYCNCCNQEKLILSCNSCGKYVCADDMCSELYPHHNNTIFAICRHCFDTIGSKIHVQVDFSKIALLKKKIAIRRNIN